MSNDHEWCISVDPENSGTNANQLRDAFIGKAGIKVQEPGKDITNFFVVRGDLSNVQAIVDSHVGEQGGHSDYVRIEANEIIPD